MTRQGDRYELTYRDANLPDHYGWKTASHIRVLEAAHQLAQAGRTQTPAVITQADVTKIIADLDAQGRWVSTYQGERLVGQPNMKANSQYLSSERFSANLTSLSRFLQGQ